MKPQTEKLVSMQIKLPEALNRKVEDFKEKNDLQFKSDAVIHALAQYFRVK